GQEALRPGAARLEGDAERMTAEPPSEDLDEVEERLRQAHAFMPRAGLQGEIRAQLRPGRTLPWTGFSAAAAVLLAVVGVGLLLHSARQYGGAATGASTSLGADRFATGRIAGFGLLPPPDFQQ